MADAGQVEAVSCARTCSDEVGGGVESASKLRIGRRRFYRWRVPGAFFVGAATLVLARPTLTSFLLGLALMVPGECLRLWASGHIEKTSRLATGGPYGHMQHPLYLGSLLIALGVAVAAARPAVFLAVGAYVLAFFPLVIRDEREFLRRKFGLEYERWTAEVPSFLPRLFPAGPRSTRFTWRRVLSNHEWKVCLAPPAALALLFLQEIIVP